MTKPPYLSVVIPVYNEADNFARGNLTKISDFLARQKFSWEIIIVDDGSTDNTLALAEEMALKSPQITVLANPHQGKAATVAAGALAARGQFILFSDMDQATPIEELAKFLPKFKSGYDIIIGSRSGRQGAPFFRQLLAYGMVVVRTLLLRLPYKDTQCGFKAFSQPAAHRLFKLMNQVHPPRTVRGPAVNPGFDVELLYLSRKLGLRIAEVPVKWAHRESKRVSFIKDATAGIKELLLVRWRSLTGAYQL